MSYFHENQIFSSPVMETRTDFGGVKNEKLRMSSKAAALIINANTSCQPLNCERHNFGRFFD